MSSCAIIIPIRIGSKRLPKKALANINGKTLCQRCVMTAQKIKNIDVFVATDSQEIIENLAEIGFKNCILTPSDLPSGTDRIFDAYKKIDKKYNFIVNLQGDMPEFHIDDVENAINAAIKNNFPITTLGYKAKLCFKSIKSKNSF